LVEFSLQPVFTNPVCRKSNEKGFTGTERYILQNTVVLNDNNNFQFHPAVVFKHQDPNPYYKKYCIVDFSHKWINLLYCVQ